MKLTKTFGMLLLFSASVAPTVALDAGVAAPLCAMKPLNNPNTSIDLQALRGQVVYVDFWASWCGPCAKSFPFMNQLHHKFKERGLRIVAVNVDEQQTDAEGFLTQQPASFPIASDSEQSCAKAFDVQAMPSTYLIDRKGVVRHVHLGFRGAEAEALQSQVEALLAESP